MLKKLFIQLWKIINVITLLDQVLQQGVMQISIEKFTLIGATTRLGLLSRPLRDRFGIQLQLDFYNPSDLKNIILLSSKKFNTNIDENAAFEITKKFKRHSKDCNKTFEKNY